MNYSQIQHLCSGDGLSQEAKILDCLQAHLGEWVGIPTLYAVSGSYVVHSRISSLRKKGCRISNRTERKDGKTHSFYKLEMP